MPGERIDYSSITEEIKNRLPIEDVISSYVTLKKAGNNIKGLCPFHSEKTPSFTIYPQTQSYYCFGCGAAGDVITFVMKAENLDYRDAVTTLAKRCGLALPDDISSSNRGTGRQRILEMNLEAARYFRSMLFDTSIGSPGREYIIKRMIPSAFVKRFGIGYAPDSFDSLHDHLKKCGFSDDEMVDADLCRRSDKSKKAYDSFRGRLIFPIIDNSSNVIGFGGRIIDPEKSPNKYINSRDTAAFKKGKNLFALNFARNHCAEKLILCEGYMDVVAMHAAGVENSVATLGTAITPEHARLLKRYTKKVVLAYDSDAAGQQATERAMQRLADVDLDSSILVIEGAKDPDEYIKKFGAEKFRQLVDGSKSKFDFRIQQSLKDRDISNPEDKIKVLNELSKFVATVHSKMEREVYIEKISQLFNIKAQSIESEVSRAIASKMKADSKKARESLNKEMLGFGDNSNRDYAKAPKLAKLEETVLGFVLFIPEMIAHKVDSDPVSAADFSTSFCINVFSAAKEQYEKTGKVEISLFALEESLNDEEINKAFSLKTERLQLDDNSIEAFENSVRALRREKSIKSESSNTVESLKTLLDLKK